MSKQFVTKEIIRHQRGIVRSLTSMVQKYEELLWLTSGDDERAEIRKMYHDTLDQLIDARIKLGELDNMCDKLIDREALSH